MPGHLMIAGTRGIPAKHGGFETFAQHLALYLVDRGWEVSVFCQSSPGEESSPLQWNRINRVAIPAPSKGALGTIVFDWKSTVIASRSADVVLVLGYNTALFSWLYRFRSIPSVINMDGIEWKRDKWAWWQRAWLYVNEQIGGLLSNYMIADHPKIKAHLNRGILSHKQIEMIPYGADAIDSAPVSPILALDVEPYKYLLLIARPEPENQILEIVRAFSSKPRGIKLLLVGSYDPIERKYQRDVVRAASDEVLFPGAIYDGNILRSLRYYAMLYLHGHTVGGTNPTLVEALGAGCAVLAHDNSFNRWVAGSGALYFANEFDCTNKLSELIGAPQRLLAMREASRKRFLEEFRWESVLSQYERLLESVIAQRA